MQKHEQWGRRWELADLESANLGRAFVYASPSVRARVGAHLDASIVDSLESTTADAETLVVAGGGTLIDRAKYFRGVQRPALRLIALPSIWGSGSEVSPVAVLTGRNKNIHCSADFVPDRYVVWPELAQSAPQSLLRFACGDVWAHALEAFCSPLATDAIRRTAAELMNEIALYPLGFDERWFDASAAAGLLQAQSSVGLIHGLAHVAEPLLWDADPGGRWGHARLCSTFLMPALEFNRSRSSKVEDLAVQYGLNLIAVQKTAKVLFDEDDYCAAMAVVQENWETILRDRCSRTNCILVRRDSVTFFQQFLSAGVQA